MEGLVGLSDSAATYARACAARLRQNPRDLDALFARAAILAAFGRRAEALVALDALGKVAPTYPALWRFKTRLYREVEDSRMEGLCLAAAERRTPARSPPDGKGNKARRHHEPTSIPPQRGRLLVTQTAFFSSSGR